MEKISFNIDHDLTAKECADACANYAKPYVDQGKVQHTSYVPGRAVLVKLNINNDECILGILFEDCKCQVTANLPRVWASMKIIFIPIIKSEITKILKSKGSKKVIIEEI
jgi:hypothetical protein